MRPGKFKIIFAVTLAVTALIISLAMQHRAGAAIREKNELLNRDGSQLASLDAENARLSNKLNEAKSAPNPAPARELERLRLEAVKLRDQTNPLAAELAQTRGSRKLLGSPSNPPGFEYTPQDLARRQEMAAGKQKDAFSLTQAFFDYYRKHDGQFPSALDQLAPYLAEKHLSLTGTNDFDFIYEGPQDNLTNFPTQMLAVLRERQPWRAPSGRWARVYGMLTIPPRVVESDDDFQSWEAEHVIPPPPSPQ